MVASALAELSPNFYYIFHGAVLVPGLVVPEPGSLARGDFLSYVSNKRARLAATILYKCFES